MAYGCKLSRMSALWNFILAQISKRKISVRFLVPLVILLSTSVYILNPGGRKYISVPGNRAMLRLSHFTNCEIAFRESTTIHSYAVSREDDAGAVQSAAPTALKTKVLTLSIHNPYADTPSNGTFRVSVFSAFALNITMTSVVVDGRNVGLDEASSWLLTPGQVVRSRYIRNDLALYVAKFNDVVSNWILTALAFGILLLCGALTDVEIKAHFMSDERLHKLILSNDSASSTDAFDKFAAGCEIRNARFQFFQALGPAIGFLLTVSSLVASLSPTLRATNDLETFMKGINVAMVSTFLGLLLRLLALEAGRANDKLFKRSVLLCEVSLSPAEQAKGEASVSQSTSITTILSDATAQRP